MNPDRRGFLMGATAASSGTIASVPASAQEINSLGERFDSFSIQLRDRIESLPAERRQDLLEFNGANDLDDLLFQYTRRYPDLSPDQVLDANQKLRDSIFGIEADREGEPVYERGPNHDREPYDKIAGGHDRIGHSRTT